MVSKDFFDLSFEMDEPQKKNTSANEDLASTGEKPAETTLDTGFEMVVPQSKPADASNKPADTPIDTGFDTVVPESKSASVAEQPVSGAARTEAISNDLTSNTTLTPEQKKRYICPFCGKEVTPQNVLFVRKSEQRYKDNIRGRWLSKHGVEVPDDYMFERMYYRPNQTNVVKWDELHYLPTDIKDTDQNALSPEELQKGRTSKAVSYVGYEEEEEDSHPRPRTRRACPKCHCELPKQFGQLDMYHMSMFGGRAAGKTAFLTTMFQKINEHMQKNRLGSLRLESQSKVVMDDMINYYEEHNTTKATHAEQGLMPFVCHYQSHDGKEEAFITLYDVAGEAVHESDYVAEHLGILSSETLLLVIDSNMLCGGRFDMEWKLNHQDQPSYDEEGGDHCEETVVGFLHDAGSLCKEYAPNIHNVVCILTKMDMLLSSEKEMFRAGSQQLTILKDIGTAHLDGMNREVLSSVKREIANYTRNVQKIDLTEELANTFGAPNCTVLGITTSTNKGNGNEINFQPIPSRVESKHRITEPFLTAMMFCGLIPYKDANGALKRYPKHGTVDEPVIDKPSKPEKKKGGFFRRR